MGQMMPRAAFESTAELQAPLKGRGPAYTWYSMRHVPVILINHSDWTESLAAIFKVHGKFSPSWLSQSWNLNQNIATSKNIDQE